MVDEIEHKHRAQMNALAEAVDRTLNGDVRGKRRAVGFVLLVFPYSKKGRCNYISNGAERADMIAMFKELIARFEGQPEGQSGTA
jgi:hypothetical protein